MGERSSAPCSDGPWYARAFGRDYLERYAGRSAEAAAREIPLLLRVLRAPPRGVLLDLCCGGGRHCLGLLRAGFRVVGVDLSAELLCHARELAPAACLARADLRALPLRDASFDGVVNLFTSFGYFESESEDLRALEEVARVLKPGAALVLDFLNLPATLATLAPLTERRVGAARVVERRRYHSESGRLEKVIRVEEPAGGAAREFIESVRAYAPDELGELLRRAGFSLSPRERYGDLLGAPFDERSPRCVWVARKVQ